MCTYFVWQPGQRDNSQAAIEEVWEAEDASGDSRRRPAPKTQPPLRKGGQIGLALSSEKDVIMRLQWGEGQGKKRMALFIVHSNVTHPITCAIVALSLRLHMWTPSPPPPSPLVVAPTMLWCAADLRQLGHVARSIHAKVRQRALDTGARPVPHFLVGVARTHQQGGFASAVAVFAEQQHRIWLLEARQVQEVGVLAERPTACTC